MQVKERCFGMSENKFIKRILVWPNITFYKDLTQDSFVQTIHRMIVELKKIRDDIHWDLILPDKPEVVYIFNYENVKVHRIPWPSFIQSTRGHFDTFVIDKITEHGNWNFEDVDLIFSHLPESTWNLVNHLGNRWHHIPPILTYSHWFDFSTICNWKYPAFMRECEGVSLSEKCYVNTESQKQLVLSEAKEYFSEQFVEDKLNSKIEPFHLPVLDNEVQNDINTNTEKIIVFNHRTKIYKDFNNIVNKVLDPLWEKRKDFKVWIPLFDIQTISNSWKHRDYIDNTKYDKKGYYKQLKKCRVGISPKQKYAGWSVATTDGMMNGCPFIMYDADYYKELYPNGDFFGDYDSAVTLLEKYLDDESYRNEEAKKSLEYVKNSLTWGVKSSKLSHDITNIINNTKSYDTNKKGYIKLVEDIKNKTMTKKEVISGRWGSSIKFTPYRKALMDDERISYYKNKENWVYEYKGKK
jgi:glycosyltransferase involved in cell wall biosynthesis